jgi:hypothetical protein
MQERKSDKWLLTSLYIIQAIAILALYGFLSYAYLKAETMDTEVASKNKEIRVYKYRQGLDEYSVLTHEIGRISVGRKICNNLNPGDDISVKYSTEFELAFSVKASNHRWSFFSWWLILLIFLTFLPLLYVHKVKDSSVVICILQIYLLAHGADWFDILWF